MNTDKNAVLYEKMAAEQDKFRDWLKSGPRRRWMPSGNCRSTGTMPPMRPSMGRWNNTTCHIRRTFLVWKPLNRQSILTMVRAGWIQRRRSKTFWKSTEQNGYSLFLPTRSGTKAVMGGSPTTIKLGQRRFTCRRTVVLPIAMPIWWWMGSIPA